MKFASYNNGTRDGLLVLVSRDLKFVVTIPGLALTFQQLMDNWEKVSDQAQLEYERLNKGILPYAVPFHATRCLAPLSRAFQWADGSAYVNHVELVRKARGATMPQSFWTEPLMYQGGSDSFVSPHADITLTDETWGMDFESEIAVITDDVPMGISHEKASQHIKLLMLVNDVTLRNLIPDELAKGFGFFQSKPASSFSPLAVTPDELGDKWQNNKVHLPLQTYLNDSLFGEPNAGIDMTFDFSQLIAHAAKTRPLCAGSIIGSGTVSNKDKTVGSSCIVEKRMLEIIDTGKASTPFLQIGDKVKIDMLDEEGNTIFGAIEQKIVAQKEK